MKGIKQLKLNNIFNYITMFLLIPFAGVLIFLFLYTAFLTVGHERELLNIAAADISQSVGTSFSNISDSMRRATYSNNFTYFSNSSKSQTVDKYAKKFLEECKTELFPYSETVGIFLYNEPCDAFYSAYHYFDALFLGQKAATLLRDDPSLLTEQPVFLKTIDSKTYLFCSRTSRYGTLTVMLDPERNISLLNYNSIYGESAVFSFSDTSAPQKNSFFHSMKGIPLYLNCVYEIRFSLYPVQMILLGIILFLLIVIPLSLWFLTRLVAKPLRVITNAMGVITAGNLDYRIPPIQNTINDIASYGKGINMMLDAIQQYKEQDFQSRMDATQAKLQYLQLQIRPHFYLNCMKNINSLIDLKEYDKAKTLVYALSGYISHAFSDIKGFVPIREELQAIQSYVDLCRALGNQIQLDFKLSGQCMDMDCLPMSLLTFVENSIKHAKNGSSLQLSISVEAVVEQDGQKKVRFLLRDSGGGFPEPTLREMEALDPSKTVYRRTQVGIANVRSRLYLKYGETASLRLRNDGDSAVVEIVTPCAQNLERNLYEYFDCR